MTAAAERFSTDRPRKPFGKRSHATDRTASPRRRCGGRRNRRLHNVPTFASDRRSAA